MTATQDSRAASLAGWVRLFTGLAGDGLPDPASIARVAAADVLFKDPFNEVRGHEGVLRVLRHTLGNVRDPRFTVLDTAWSGERAFLKWRMTGTVRYVGHWEVTGMSEITFDGEGRVKAHVDYWDAASQLYARLPGIGWLCRALLRAGAA